MNSHGIEIIKHPEKLSSYFKAEILPLAFVTVTGILYNTGMVAGPWFQGRMVQCLYDILNQKAVRKDMVRLAVSYAAVILLVQICRATKRFFVRRFANDTARNMRHMLYNNLVWQSRSTMEKESTGSIMTRAVSDVDACVEGMRKFTTEIFDTGVVLLSYLIFLFRYDFRLTLLSCLFIPLAYFSAHALRTPVYRAGSAAKISAGKLNTATLDRIRAALTYRVYGQEENRNTAYEERLTDYERTSVRSGILETTPQPLYHVISMAGVIFIIVFGSRNVNGTGWSHWDLAAFTAFLSCFIKMAQKSSSAAKLFNSIQKAQVSWNRIRPLMHEYQEADTKTDLDFLSQPTLSVTHLSVSYPGGAPLVSDLSFVAEPGQIIGVTGPVASGKSALGKVFLCEFPYSGSITIGGRELSTLTPYERSRLIAYEGHDPELLGTTIDDNIKLGESRRDTPVLQAVDLYNEVSAMPDKGKTYIGDGGMRLSGGQKARTALARALYGGQSILVLDDPFSSVDVSTEDRIMEHLEQDADGRITLLISHRLSAFPDLDRIVFLSGGKAVTGSHAELMKTCPEYRSLFELQTKGGKKA